MRSSFTHIFTKVIFYINEKKIDNLFLNTSYNKSSSYKSKFKKRCYIGWYKMMETLN